MDFLNDPGSLNILLFGSIGLVFYFFILRPQTKKAKEQETFWDTLSVSDQVVTNGGIFGKIEKLNKETVTLNVGNNNTIKFAKSAISMDLSKTLGKVKSLNQEN